MRYSALFLSKLASLALIALSVCGSTGRADEYLLRSSVGQCEYDYSSVKDIRRTKCSAKALFINSQTSEVFSCLAAVEGDQYVAPSVIETAPDAVDCTLIGQPFTAKGSYSIELADDAAKADKSLNRMHGSFSWHNAFWVHSRQSAEVRFCTALLAKVGANRLSNCSRKTNWIR